MKIAPNLQYVEQMRNIGYLTGFVRHLNKIECDTWHKRQLENFNGYLLQQNGNIEQAIPIHVPEGVPLPADKSPLTVAVHVFGYTDPVTGEQNLKVKSIDSARPSVRAMPVSMAWSLNSNKKHANDDFNPFGKGSKLSSVLEEAVDENNGEFTDSEAALQKMLEASNGKLDTRLGQNANVIMIAGFLDSFRKQMPNEHKTNSFWSVHLRQHEPRDRVSAVRIYTKDMKGIGSCLKRGMPAAFTGQIRVKVTPNDNKDGLLEGLVYIRTDDIKAPDRVKDIRTVPSWYGLMKEEQEKMRALQKEALQKAKEKTTQTPADEASNIMSQLTTS